MRKNLLKLYCGGGGEGRSSSKNKPQNKQKPNDK